MRWWLLVLAACGRIGFEEVPLISIDAAEPLPATCTNGFGIVMKPTVVVGSGPRKVEIADVDLDGKRDIIATNGNSNTISVVLGIGDGTFRDRQDYPTGAHPWALAVGDLDGNQLPDIVAASFDDNMLGVFLNKGGGQFSARIDYATGKSPQSVVIGDVDSNGTNDVVVTQFAVNTIGVFLGTGTGGLRTRVDYPTGVGPYEARLGDLDGDGRVDIVTANTMGPSMSVVPGKGAGAFAPPIDYAIPNSQPWALAVGDLDNSGKLDVVVANNYSDFVDGQTLAVFQNKGDGSFGGPILFPASPHPWWVEIADIDADGKLDVVTANGSDTTGSAFRGNGDGTLDQRSDHQVGAEALCVAVGDLTGDRRPDFAFAIAGGVAIFVTKCL